MNIDNHKNDNSNDNLIESISCERFDAFIVDYIDDNLTDTERNIFLKHLLECPPCKHYLENYQRSISLSQQALSDEKKTPQETIPEELVQAILAARKHS